MKNMETTAGFTQGKNQNRGAHKITQIARKWLCLLLVFLTGSLPCTLGFADEYKPYVPFSASRITGNAYIPAGSMVSCELITPLNSGKNYAGERVQFKTIQDVVVSNVIVIPQGTIGEAVVSDVSRAGSFGKGGRITIATKTMPTINGQSIPVRAEMSRSGGGESGWVVPAFLVVSVLAAFVRGKNQDLPAGTRFSVAVETDTDLRVPPEELASVMKSPTAVAPINNTLGVKSYPDVMSIGQAAEYLQTSPEIVQKMINDGKLKANKIGDDWRLKKTDIDSYLAG